MRELDVPTRGTAWVEDQTGKILQTELQIRRPDGQDDVRQRCAAGCDGAGHDADTATGHATYGNFRPFIVQVDEAVKAGFQ
jgi:hypothetical protein